MAVIEVLVGHTSPETAHVTIDYPYGFRLRCQRREWLEYKPKKGYRFVTQTSNPKPGACWVPCGCTGGYVEVQGVQTVCVACHGNGLVEKHVWNAPKASVYVALAVLYLDEANHVQWDTLHIYATERDIDAFEAQYGPDFEGERERQILAWLRAVAQECEARKAKMARTASTAPLT